MSRSLTGGEMRPNGSARPVPDRSRRALLAGSVAAAAGALAGCNGGGADDGGSGIDTFRAAFQGHGTGEEIDPGTSNLFIDEARLKAMYDGLYELDDSMTPVPRLAESGEPNVDGTRWRLQLRDARWHDGTKLTSADVLYTLARILGPAERTAFTAATTLGMIDLSACRTPNDRTVEIGLKRPCFELPTALCSYGTRIVQDGTRDFSRPVGTGPFRFESFEPGKQLVATAYNDYWDGSPRIRRLIILSVDANARRSALQSGQADFADQLPASAVRVLQNDARVRVHTIPDSGAYYFAMKADRPPFDDPAVRQAMMRLADREELVRVALQGEAEVGNDVFGHGYRYYADGLGPHDYDPDRAQALLRDAGVSDLTFELFAAPVAPGMMEAANLLVDHAKRAGVRIRVRHRAKDTYYAETMNSGVLTMGQSGPLPIPNHFAERLLSNAARNRTHWSDETFDQLYDKAQRTRDGSARARIYHRMHEIHHERGSYMFWAYPRWHNAAGSDFRNIPTGITNSLHWARFDKVAR